MTASNRGMKNRSAIRNIRSRGAQPEDIGNKRTFEEVRVPPDDMGNKAEELDVLQAFVRDGIGNSLDETPSHLKSGILSQLAKKPGKTNQKRRVHGGSRDGMYVGSTDFVPARQAQGEPIESMSEELADLFRGEDYMQNLISEFAQLLKSKSGQPFSFSMKESQNSFKDDETDEKTLSSFSDLIKNILTANEILAQVELTQYYSSKHRVAVFFISPGESDPLKNKELISALRKALSHSVKHILQYGINVFLALANAQGVIEEHLASLGAKKD